MSNINSRVVLTVVTTVLVLNALWRTFQQTQFLLHLWPYTQYMASHGVPKVAAMDAEEIVSTVLTLLTWWGMAVLAWLMRSEALRRSSVGV